MKLHEFLAASGNTKFFDERFEIWVHYSPNDAKEEECERIEVSLYNIIKYAGYDVIYFGSDYQKSKGSYITVGICAPDD